MLVNCYFNTPLSALEMVHVHPRWPVLTLEGVESIGAVEEEEDTEVVVEDTEEVEDTRVVEAVSGGLEGIVAVGVDTGGLIEVASGGLVGVDTEDLMGVEDTEEVEVGVEDTEEVEEEKEDMEGGDSEEAGGETGVVIKAERLNKDIFGKV